MNLWQQRPVADLCQTVTSGGTPRRGDPANYSAGTVPWIKTGDLRDNVVRDYDEHISEVGVASSSAKLLPAGTVLMAMYGATVGKLGWLSEPAACNQAACAMIADPARAHGKWLFYSLLHYRDALVTLANGAAQQNLSGQTIKAFAMPTPPVNEQRAIAEVLGALDDKIAANDDLVAAATSLMVAIASMSGGKVTLSEVAKHSKVSLNPGDFEPEVAHFSLPAFDADCMPEVAADDSIKSNKFRVNAPCVLVSKLNPRIPRIWNVSSPPAMMSIASTEFVVLRPEGINASVLWAALAQPDFSSELTANVAGTSGSHQRVLPAEIMSTQVLDPRRLSNQAAETITCLGASVHQYRLESSHLRQTRDQLLPLLMLGKVRVRDAEKVVEQVL